LLSGRSFLVFAVGEIEQDALSLPERSVTASYLRFCSLHSKRGYYDDDQNCVVGFSKATGGLALRILLIDPPLSSESLSIGLASIASFLIQHGHEVRVFDLTNERRFEGERIRSYARWSPEIIGISVNSFSTAPARVLASTFSTLNPGAKIVAGGPEPSSRPLWFLQKFPEFEYSVQGDGEEPMLGLAEGREPAKVVGLYNRRGLPPREDASMVGDLDKLPFPDYDVFDSVSGHIDRYPIMTSRGCPFNCSFCLNSVLSKRKWRARSPSNVIEEIRVAKGRYGFRILDIWDDCFNLDLDRAKHILGMIKSEHLGIEVCMGNGVRADRVDADFLQLLREVGGKTLWFGAEDLNPDTAAWVRKGETPEQIERAIKLAKNEGFDVGATMIIGLPGQTRESVEYSLRRVKRLGIRAQWFHATPFVGTRLHDWASRNSTMFVEPDAYSVQAPAAKGLRAVIFETGTFTRTERLDIFYRANIATNDLAFLAQVEPHLDGVLWRYDKTKCVEYISKKMLAVLRRRIARSRRRDQTRSKEVAARLDRGEMTPKEAISTLRRVGQMP
jgi:radical SAM superfamily enzyme YgiQ (UPF0313 family)